MGQSQQRTHQVEWGWVQYYFVEEYSEYFKKQYFENPDYFKRKVDEDSPWNMSYTLYKKHYDIKKEKAEYVFHVPTANVAYWERKVDMKE